MRLKLLAAPILAVSFILSALSAHSQTIAPYQAKGFPIVVGVGPSSFDPDWGNGRMWGGAAWADWYPRSLRPGLQGLGIEVEVRDISLDKHLQPGNADPQRSGQANTKEDTAGGGIIYNWRHFRRVQPYAKFIVSEGSVDFISSSLTYSHDTRMVMAPGGGLEYRMFGPLWARVDYEYQDWGTLLHETLTPSGFTFGVSYDFSPRVP
jgi:opacity protein-like surface antigen